VETTKSSARNDWSVRYTVSDLVWKCIHNAYNNIVIWCVCIIKRILYIISIAKKKLHLGAQKKAVYETRVVEIAPYRGMGTDVYTNITSRHYNNIIHNITILLSCTPSKRSPITIIITSYSVFVVNHKFYIIHALLRTPFTIIIIIIIWLSWWLVCRIRTLVEPINSSFRFRPTAYIQFARIDWISP